MNGGAALAGLSSSRDAMGLCACMHDMSAYTILLLSVRHDVRENGRNVRGRETAAAAQ